jgi:hypothetical protein
MIPMFSEEIQLTAKRMPKYFEWKDHDKLPNKYQTQRYIWSMDKGGQRRLFDSETKAFVVKNAVSVSRPRMMTIAGNEFFPGLDEHIRMKVVEHLKSEFQRHFPVSLELSFPVLITEELHTLPRYANWDLDNMWIYTKCFQDAIVEYKQIKEKYIERTLKGDKVKHRIVKPGIIPDDTIKYITLPSAPRFIPVTREEDRAMIYTLTEDWDPRIRGHLLYNMYPVDNEQSNAIKGFLISPCSIGKPGDLAINVDNANFMINIGRKMDIDKAIKKAYERVFYHCIQMNIREVTIQENMYNAHVERELCQKGVKVWRLIA